MARGGGVADVRWGGFRRVEMCVGIIPDTEQTPVEKSCGLFYKLVGWVSEEHVQA